MQAWRPALQGYAFAVSLMALAWRPPWQVATPPVSLRAAESGEAISDTHWVYYANWFVRSLFARR